MYVGFIHSHDNSVEAETFFVFAKTEFECLYKILGLVKEHHPDNFWNEIQLTNENSVRFITEKDKPKVFVEGEEQKTVDELKALLSDLVSGCDNGDYFYFGCLPQMKYVLQLEFNESWYDQGWNTSLEVMFADTVNELKYKLKKFMLDLVSDHQKLPEDWNYDWDLKTTCVELNKLTYDNDFDADNFKYKILTLPDLKEVG